ncbi:unnamed protein product [Amoebophrya sp. A25]|nr:unnamed protein product [Amoebophrya sp. A25]|eukprot:GSA25T00005385001.1
MGRDSRKRGRRSPERRRSESRRRARDFPRRREDSPGGRRSPKRKDSRRRSPRRDRDGGGRRHDSKRRPRDDFSHGGGRDQGTTSRSSKNHTSSSSAMNSRKPKLPTNPLVFLDLEFRPLRGGYAGSSAKRYRLEIELYEDIVPETADRFQGFCRRGDYEDVPFHRIIPGFMAQGGDISNRDGTGGLPKGRTEFYKDENFICKHSGGKYLLSCANNGDRNTNSAQFFITLGKALPHLDGKHCVFGEVRDRLGTRAKVMRKLEGAGSKGGEPKAEVMIVDCGEILEGEDSAGAALSS